MEKILWLHRKLYCSYLPENLFYSLHIYCVEVGSKAADMKFLTKDQKSFYSENGYIKLENILTNDEINHMSKEYDDIFQVGT